MILIDYSSIAIASVFSQVKSDKIEESFIRHLILNTLRMYNVKHREKYGRMILACDGGSWRKHFYKEYKAARRKNRESSSLDWAEIFRILNKIKDEIQENMPYTVLTVKDCEADDVIGVLVNSTQEFGQGEPVMIISADKDFIQLQKFSNVSQFSPMTKKLVSDKNPSRYLFEHIIRGDSGDGVPNILSADDVFISNCRQTPLSSKKIEEWYSLYKSGDFEKSLNENVRRNYIRNKTVIDLDNTPEEIKNNILEQYHNSPQKGNSKILNYLIVNRCNQLVGCANEFFTKS